MPRPFIGLISDTHGLLRPETLEALEGAVLIVHAGDIGPVEVLDTLRSLAPTVAVRGNTDHEPWCSELRTSEVVEHEALRMYVLHDEGQLYLDPAAAGFAAVICGHTHMPWVSEREGVMYINPGSAGPKREGHPITLMRLFVEGDALEPEVVDLTMAS